jgi:hypothetical protein
MAEKRYEQAITIAIWIYRLLIRAYPATYRDEYAQAMAQLFRDSCRAAARSGGLRGLLGLWWDVAVDIAVTLPAMHRAEGILRPAALCRVSGLASSIAGVNILVLFLAWPSGTFWPIGGSVLLATALCLLPIGLIGAPLNSYTGYPQYARLVCLLTWGGASLPLVGFFGIYFLSIHPPEGIFWRFFVGGFLSLGLGLSLSSLLTKHPNVVFRLGRAGLGATSTLLYLGIDLIHAYPFDTFFWRPFGAALIVLGGGIWLSGGVASPQRPRPFRSFGS